MNKTNNRMMPCNPLLFVSKNEVKMLSVDEISLDIVGEKAYGLSALPCMWTLPFFVISSLMFEEYSSCKDFEYIKATWEERIFRAAAMCGIEQNDDIVVRSNSNQEGLNERGKYTSEDGILSDWPKLVKLCLDDALTKESADKNGMPLIVQKKVLPLLQGHISNERRVAKEVRDWRGEYELALPKVFSIPIRTWRSRVNVENFLDKHLECPNDKFIEKALSIPCSWATLEKKRVHFEWIYDGNRVYLVQADIDVPHIGVDPKKIIYTKQQTSGKLDNFVPQCLHLLKDDDCLKYKKYPKVQNPLLYYNLGFAIAPLYILDDAKILDELYNGKINTKLRNDLQYLIQDSLVIRIDIDTDDNTERQLLPRTCSLYKLEEAENWLIKEYKKLRDNVQYKIIFILHNFIPAFSSAFAYASPSDKIVKIESLWGVPEGLYYYSHDNYIVDTKYASIDKTSKDLFQISSDINYKKYFVYPTSDGDWTVQILATPFDWEPSISEAWIKEIAFGTRKISAKENKSISVMWFAGVDFAKYNCDVFPWYHEAYDYQERISSSRNKLPFGRTYAIHSLFDIEQLEKSYEKSIRSILLQPTDAILLRDINIIKKIGDIAKKINATVILEGGILSHAYYQLLRTGAKVEAVNSFDKRKNQSFNKLVRDKIPQKIERNGEEVITMQLDTEIFIQLLKRKLVEESLEVFDSDNYDDVISEIADLQEVLDSLILQIGSSRQEIQEKREKKRKTVGGFEQGVFLKNTSSYKLKNEGKIIDNSEPVNMDLQVSKSTDVRKYATANEFVTKIKIPVSIDKWENRPNVRNKKINIVLKGERKKDVMHIEVSIFEEAEQIAFFD